MLLIDGFRLINTDDNLTRIYDCHDGTVDTTIVKKYAVNKKNAFDPTILIKRNPYYVTTINCTAILEAGQVDDLNEFLNQDNLIIEFDSGGITRQYSNIEVTKPLPIKDDSRTYTTRVKFSLKSTYKEYKVNDITITSVIDNTINLRD